eukprot:1194940-Prorocentrum_minimum.AAC.6
MVSSKLTETAAHKPRHRCRAVGLAQLTLWGLPRSSDLLSLLPAMVSSKQEEAALAPRQHALAAAFGVGVLHGARPTPQRTSTLNMSNSTPAVYLSGQDTVTKRRVKSNLIASSKLDLKPQAETTLERSR